MKLSSVIQIGVLLSLSMVSNQIDRNSSSTVDIFTLKAFLYNSFKWFLISFRRFTLPLKNDVDDGAKLYRKIKAKDFNTIGISGVAHALPLEQLHDLISIFVQKELIYSEEAVNMLEILSQQNFKTILEHVYIRGNGEIIYGTTGFIGINYKDGETRHGSILYSLAKFMISANPVITFKRNGVNNRSSCILWGQYCKTTFKVDGLSDSESQSLFSYMHHEAVKQFNEENSPFVINTERQAIQYAPLLPQAVKHSLEKWTKNLDKLPDELFKEDPFDISKL